jgi:hypothetical protein
MHSVIRFMVGLNKLRIGNVANEHDGKGPFNQSKDKYETN